ncbi:MAG: acyl-CoA dehydrogenase family protein [Actinomycetota bacterium]|nr:acyl-CoA dehydrogenase family protein [Actinomycetota bacterium]
MAMNCKPVPTLDDRINDIRMRTAEIINDDVLPNEGTLWAARRHDETVTERAEVLELRASIQEKVKKAGLWAPHLPTEYGGMGLDFMAHAYMNEVLSYAIGAAKLFGVVAPNSGNQKILVKYGTEQQKQDWLLPTIEGTMESGFSMTEPHNPGSDPRAIDTTAVLDGDHYVINGHKWFTSNGIEADFFIVMCRVVDKSAMEPGGDRKTGPMVQIIVPTATKGVNIVRGIGVWGKRSTDHCEVKYEDARVPVANALGRVGDGHQAAQDRLGAGRIYHCMNCIGQMWRAFDLMVHRAATRQVHGGLLADQQFTQGAIADSYIDIQTARLFTIHAAEKIDQGLAAARTDISAIKVYVPSAYTRVVDRAIQIWGAAGVSNDLPLFGMYQGARTLRIADGPDEVHKILIAKNVLGRYAKGEGWDFGN